MLHREKHRTDRIGWLRATVLGANDGVVSTASLIVGVAAAHATSAQILIAGATGLVAGTMSMAAGEYVSVSSQADTEAADIAIEEGEIAADPGRELIELARIYESRGLDPALATQVAEQLTARDASGAHARDELGIFYALRAKPVQAAFASSGSFAVGAAMPLLTVVVSAERYLILLVSKFSLLLLALLGGAAAFAGGASARKGALSVTLWGAFAMVITAPVGTLFGAVR